MNAAERQAAGEGAGAAQSLGEAFLAQGAAYRIEQLFWYDDDLVLDFTFEHPLLDAAPLDVSLVLAADAGVDASEKGNAAADLAALSLFAFPMQSESVAPNRHRYHVEADPLSVLADWVAAESVDPDGQDAQSQRFLFRLRVGLPEGGEALLPFGCEQDAGLEADFRRHAVVGWNLLVPVLDNSLNLGFDLEPHACAVERSASPRISDLIWEDDDTLVLAGMLDHPLAPCEDFSLSLCLVSDAGGRHALPAQLDEPEGSSMRWSCRLTPSRLFDGLAPATWCFAFEKGLGDAFAVESFGDNRPGGSLAEFASNPVSVDDGVWLPGEVDGGMLGFTWMDAAQIESIAEPTVTGLAWTNAGMLQMSGTIRHPLAAYRRFYCDFGFDGPDESVVIGLQRQNAPSESFDWTVSFPVREKLQDREGDWHMVFYAGYGNQEGECPVGPALSDEAAQAFCSGNVGRSMTPFRSEDGTLGVRIEKPKRRLFRR